MDGNSVFVSLLDEDRKKRADAIWNSYGDKPAPLGIFEIIGRDVGALVDRKQVSYGDSYGKAGGVLKILYPNGIPVDSYDDALAIVRVIDKLFRIASEKDAFGESPWKDIAGYAILGCRGKGAHASERNEK